MNWSRCSRPAIAALFALTLLVGSASAVSVSGHTPTSATVGSQQTATYTFTDLYGQYDAWTLQGSTNLTEVTWTVTLYDQTGAKIDQHSYTGANFEQAIKASAKVNKVRVRVEGTVPKISQYSYDPPQNATVASFTQAHQGGASNAIGKPKTLHPYTQRSQTARKALDGATQAIDDAQSSGASVGSANSLLQNAVSAYDAGNFANAESLAKSAKSKANSARSSAHTTHWLLIGVGVVVVLVVIGGALWWYQNSRESYDRLG